MARTRSPNYPSLSLPEAIAMVGAIYDKNHQAKMDKLSVATALGYGSLHGIALTSISALTKYGLLDKDDQDFKVSPAAVYILKDRAGTQNRNDALSLALASPSMFGILLDRYGTQKVDPETVAIFLETSLGFKPQAAKVLAKNFRESVEFVTEQFPGYNGATELPQEDVAIMPQSQAIQGGVSQTPPPATPTGAEQIRYRISPNCQVTLSFEGPVTQQAIGKLGRYLDIAKEDYPETEMETEAEPNDQDVD